MRRRFWWIIVILAVLLSPIAWYLGSPLFINKTVDEPFPTTSAPAQHPSPRKERQWPRWTVGSRL